MKNEEFFDSYIDQILEYDEFVTHFTDELKKYLNDDNIHIERQKRMQVNGEAEHLIVSFGDSSVCPALRLQPIFDDYQAGIPFFDLVPLHAQSIKEAYILQPSIPNFNATEAHKALQIQLIPRKGNEDLLKDTPHFSFLDMAAIPRWVLPQGSLIVSNNVATYLTLCDEEVLDIALQNTKNQPYKIESLTQVLLNMVKDKAVDDAFKEAVLAESENNIPLYAITNEQNKFAASALLCPNVLDAAFQQLHEEFYILPSSTDEILVLPKSSAPSVGELTAMVEAVNEEVDPRLVLSNNVYQYDSATGKVSIAKAEEIKDDSKSNDEEFEFDWP